MQYAIVQGNVVATRKVEDLQGIALKVLLPCDSQRKANGEPVIAIDSIGARIGDLVLWVDKREASMAVSSPTLQNSYPVDAAVTGIVDAIG